MTALHYCNGCKTMVPHAAGAEVHSFFTVGVAHARRWGEGAPFWCGLPRTYHAGEQFVNLAQLLLDVESW